MTDLVQTRTSDGVVLAEYHYKHDLAGNRTETVEVLDTTGDGVAETNLKRTFTYTYDALNRLTTETYNFGSDTNIDPEDYTDTYTFDLAGNRTEQVHDQQSNGSMTDAGDATTTYQYNTIRPHSSLGIRAPGPGDDRRWAAGFRSAPADFPAGQ